ncbi:MAG: HlyD family type I secretion periplasmic adaptor subunit [Proteobacteria bacterium]|nr:HlyD family type I secretion periplasmic adaptor subunit [Pseudomonadota bacterium]
MTDNKNKTRLYISALRSKLSTIRFTLNLGKDDAHEFKPTMVEIEERPVNPLGRIIFWVIIAAMVFFTVWMCLGKVDVVVSARGLVIPDGDVKIIQPLDTGVVSSILCREGDFVRKGQVLMDIDPSITAPEFESKEKTLRHLELEKHRIDASLGKKAFGPDAKKYDRESVRTQRELYQSSVAGLEKQIEAKKAELRKTEEEINSTEKERLHNEALLDIATEKEKRLKGVIDIISRSEYEKALNDVLTYGNNVEQAKGRIDRLAQQKNQILHEMAYINENFKTTSLKEFSDKHKQSTEIKAEMDKTSFRNEKQRILSPVEGYVANLFVHTVGGVVTPAQKLMVVVPAGTHLVMKTTVLNKDIGFVKDGMPVLIKIDTFDFQKYGTLNGTVRNVSKHSTEDEKLGPVYEVFISPLETHIIVEGNKTEISSGMSLTAEIKVGKRRIIEFFIYPIIKYLDEGIKVR